MILAAINVSPFLYKMVIISIAFMGIGLLLRRFKQPYVIAYILAGILLGGEGFGIITEKEMINNMGEIGLILLLFFIGMEVNLPNLLKYWKPAILGTALQIVGSVLVAYLLGQLFGWSVGLAIVIGFIISLSSSAVVVKLLEDNHELKTPIGQKVLGILLTQDILIVPMLIAINYLSGHLPATEEIIRQLIGGSLIVGILVWLLRREKIKLPYAEIIMKDHELQIFAAFTLCFGCALATAFFGLSAALGAFIAGMVVHASNSTKWFHETLHPFRVLFVSLFFVSIGMLISIDFLKNNWETLALLIGGIYVTNHLLNTFILKYFGSTWKESWYGGALLAQIGELSFVLAATGYNSGVFSEYLYHLTIAAIALSLLLSPFWIQFTKNWCHYKSPVLLKKFIIKKT